MQLRSAEREGKILLPDLTCAGLHPATLDYVALKLVCHYVLVLESI